MKLIKFKNLFFGFIIGCVVGGSLVWWQKAYLIDKLIEKGFHIFSYVSDSDENKIDNENDKKHNKNSNTKNIYPSSNEEKYAALDAEAPVDNAYISNDSVLIDSFNRISDIDDNFSVVKEELLFSKSLKMINLDDNKELVNNADTMFLEENIGDNKVSPYFSVEFWKSPINYKGYKTGKNKIVLYGIYDFKRLSLKKQNDILYLLCDDKYYIIENTNDFKPLAILSNKNLISQLGEK